MPIIFYQDFVCFTDGAFYKYRIKKKCFITLHTHTHKDKGSFITEEGGRKDGLLSLS